MYKILALLIAASLMQGVSAWPQKKFSLSVYTGSGISFFGGPGATSESVYDIGDLIAVNKMRNPYGKKPFTNFFAGVQAGLTLSSNWVLMLSTQYEQTGARLTADTIYYLGPSTVDGKYKRYYDFISVNPQIGKIVFQNKVTATLHAGLDYAFRLRMGNQFDYTDQSGQKYSIGFSGDTPETNDIRISFGGSITRKKWSLDLNYKHSLSNYNKNANDKVFERLIHIHLLYAFIDKKI